MTSFPTTFKPIHAEFWSDLDAWDSANPMECRSFKHGYVQLAKGGYWFPYRQFGTTGWISDWILVNMVKPHVLV